MYFYWNSQPSIMSYNRLLWISLQAKSFFPKRDFRLRIPRFPQMVQAKQKMRLLLALTLTMTVSRKKCPPSSQKNIARIALSKHDLIIDNQSYS